MTEGPAPLFRLARASFALGDGSSVGPLDAQVTGERLALIGDWSGYFRLLEGRAQLTQGSAEIMGVPVSESLARGVVGFAPLDLPLPARLTALAYLTESARLLGRGRAFAQSRAQATVRLFELEHLARRQLGTLRVAERRVLAIAAAALGEPPVLCFEAPLERLDDAAAAYVEAALERAREGRLSLVSALELPALGRERALLERSERWLVLEHGEARPRGPFDAEPPPSHLLLTVSERAAAFAEALRALGLEVTSLGHVDALFALLTPSPETAFERFLVVLPSAESRQQIIAASLESGAPLLEMRPFTPAR
jgi:ABC-type Na+ transport system ATPase subunit NatA